MILKPPEFIRPIYGHPLGPGRGLAGCWPFNEGTGNKVLDLSGNGNTGTFINSPIWTSGKVGSTVDFPGSVSDEHIDCGDSPVFQFEYDTPYTIVMSVKRDIAGAAHFLVAKASSVIGDNYRGYSFLFESTDVLRAFLINDTSPSNYIDIVTDATFTDTTSYHQVAMTYDGSTNASGVFIYYDGAKQAVTPIVDTLSATIKIAKNLNIGIRNGINVPLNGRIEYVYIYNCALSASGIDSLYREPFCMFERDM